MYNSEFKDVMVDGVSYPVDVYRNKHRVDTAYHVVAGCAMLGQIVKHSACSWEAQTFGGRPAAPKFKRRHLAVDYLIREFTRWRGNKGHLSRNDLRMWL